MADEVNRQVLTSTIERIERLEEEATALKADVKQIYEEAKEKGLNPKMIKKVISYKKMDPEKRRIDEAEFEVYKEAAGID
jgi:uncharacterized protein (UPF0335 family)